MQKFKMIITGATGMVGEGVLFECLEHPDIKQVLLVNRRPYTGEPHPKLKECIIPDFFKLDGFEKKLSGYDGCLYCAGVSSLGKGEAEYTRITYDTTLHFATKLASLNPKMVFNYVSGSRTDDSHKGKVMWARVKGRTESALVRLPFKRAYNFRPGFMKPAPGQQNVNFFYKALGTMYPVLKAIFPSQVCTMREVGLSMINAVIQGYDKQTLEVKDIKLLAQA